MAKTAEDLLSQSRRYTECDGFRIQSLDEYECSQLEALWSNRFDKTRELDLSMRRELVCMCLVDDDGKRLFSSGDMEKLKTVDSSLIKRLYRCCRDHCGFDEQVVTEGKSGDSDSTEDSD